jgi:hypothetical protein
MRMRRPVLDSDGDDLYEQFVSLVSDMQHDAATSMTALA